MKLTDACIEKPVFAWMLMAATLLFGGVAASRMGISQFPDVDFPTVTVSVTWEGAAPEVMEHDVVEPLEEALVQVEGLREITSTSRQGSANITLELDLSRPVDTALQDVQSRVSHLQRHLPKDIDAPVASKSNPEDQPILWVGLSGPYPRQMLADFARYRLKEKLQTVPGVGEIALGGYLDRNVRLWVDAAKLDERGLTVQDLLSALQREHVELPAGIIQAQGREVNVRVMGEALDLDTLRRLVVREVAGQPVRLGDVALVEDGFEDLRRVARLDGQVAQGMGIRKQRGANAVAVATAVREALDEVKKGLPPGMECGVYFDSTKFISESVHEIEFEILLAILLTAFVCWLFLGSFSSTLNVVLAIPMSLFGTVAVIYFLGFTLNTFTLLGLTLAVGVVVDDAIMVMENIFRHAEGGKERRVAAREGTEEITFAALAATLAVVAIFLPIVFMKGLIGRYFLQFGVTLSLAVLLSYLEAITLAPARCSQFIATSREGRSRVGLAADRVFDALARGYGRLLASSLKHPYVILLAGVAVLVASVLAARVLPAEFVPSQDQSQFQIRLQTAVGSSLEEADRVFQRAESFVRSRPEVERTFISIGGGGGGSTAVNAATMFVTLVPPKARKLGQAELFGVLRKELNSYAGLRATMMDPSQAGFTAQRGFPVEFSVRGPDWEQIVGTSQELTRKLQARGAVVDLDTDYQVGMPELQIAPNRARASDLGVSTEALATTLNALVGGVRVGKYSVGGRRIDVRLRLLATQRARPEDLARLKVRNDHDQLIPLAPLVSEVEKPALQAITRRARERAVSIFGNVANGRSQEEALALVETLAKDLPPGVHVVLGGASVAFRESMSGLLFALMMGIAIAYMVLASQFNSFLHPITVITILPLSAAGAVGALWALGFSLNIFSMIGLLLLMGIVKKNSIILVDYANRMREEGHDPTEAMKRAGPVRLRPILMTSVSTMMCAVPAALMLGPGGETRAPMAVSILGGLIVSTALSLLVVPAFYVAAERWRSALGRLFRGRAPAGPKAGS
ncbi:MAG TPA: efflux RND transporter permease subunit [Myxococcales bacterium]